MNDSLKQAKDIMISGDYTCVFLKQETIYKSKLRGVAPVLELIDKNIDLTDFIVSDKVVGKAAAMLFVYAKIDSVYTKIISKSAAKILKDNDIEFFCDNQIDHVINRAGNDLCPLEKATMDIDDIELGYKIIRKTLENLKK